MYLKSIEMQGFKSFANRMLLEFHDGITGIVGPNGSGKSNVADAVRWVLGEQSAKQLRGGNMQDVIFSGTEMRRQLGYAQVAITLDNADKSLHVDYKEVTVTRRLYRSGESEYLLNGTACRLKDINELFYDTGIGKEGYSIIGQGQIDQILSGKPEDRRELFDEAAGIVKYKRRKAATLKKLTDEQQNMVRVTDILTELTRQLTPLAGQAGAAKSYLEKRQRLKACEIRNFLIHSEQSKCQIAQVDEKIEGAAAHTDELRSAFDETRQEYTRLEGLIEEQDVAIEDARKRLADDALKKQQLVSNIELLKEQIHTLKMNLEHFGERSAALSDEIAKRQAGSEKYREEEAVLKSRLAREEQDKEEKERALGDLKMHIEGGRVFIEESKQKVLRLLSERNAISAGLQRYDTMLEQLQIQKAASSRKLLDLKRDEAGRTGKIEELKETGERLKEKAEQLQEAYAGTEQQIQDAGRQLTEQLRVQEAGISAYHREASRLESLKSIAQRYDGYAGGIRRVMEQKKTNPGIHGVVADLIEAGQRFELAIETALGGSIQNIVTDNETTAKYLIEFLKRGRYGRATFLPLTAMHKKKPSMPPGLEAEPGVLGIACDLVSYAPAYEGLINHLLGRTIVVDSIDHAIGLGRKYKHTLRMVTLEGELISPGGSMTGGAFKNSGNLLGRRREISDLERNVKQLKKEMDGIRDAIEESRAGRNALRSRREELNEALQRVRLDQNTAAMQYKAADEAYRELKIKYSDMHDESAAIENKAAAIERERQEKEAELAASRRAEEAAAAAAAEKEAELEKLLAQQAELAASAEKARMEYANTAQQAGFLDENIQRLKGEQRDLEEELRLLTGSRSGDGEAVEKKEAEIGRIREAIERFGDAYLQGEQDIAALNLQKEQLAKSHKGLLEKREEIQNQLSLLDKENFRLQAQREKLDEAMEKLIAYMWEEYEITPARAAEIQAAGSRTAKEPDGRELAGNITKLKKEIRDLGPVNVGAIETYREVKERHGFMQSQYDDLVTATKSLEGIVAELDTGMRRQFAEKFGQIQTEFNKVFGELFGGGRGTLELVDEGDILEAGIRIISQPPGKKLQNMMQLSGGEKALTAIALLFAIQNLKPSPFCLLDEIEAALDDSNVTRFANYLKKLTKNTQFIIITHRRGTMNEADRLYGITMQEKGISTLVSVNLIESELN